MHERLALPRFTFWQRFIRIAIVLGLLWNFRDHLYLVILGLWNYFKNHIPIPLHTLESLIIITGGILILLFTYVVYIFWFAQFVLPVVSLPQRLKAFKRLLLYGISLGRWHGPAVFVRDGHLIGEVEELEKTRPGVAFVDSRSAMALDKQLSNESDLSFEDARKPQKVQFLPFGLGAISASIRVVGPGLTFIEKNERITGTVDLRKQSRFRAKVSADTRDGIHVETGVSSAFTIGQPPDVLEVCLGGANMDRVFVIEWDSNWPISQKKVKTLSEELHPGDEQEIYKFIQAHPDPSTVLSDVTAAQFPFTFDPKRVEQAIYTETHVYDPVQNQNSSKKWSEWPQDVATEIFRILLAQQPYMHLYAPRDPVAYPMTEFKRSLFKTVRNTGILAYRVVVRRDGQLLQAGKTYQTRDLIFYPPRNLTRSNVLRDRGIKVLSASFGELNPKESSVRERLMQSWLSAKQREVDVQYADHDLEVARVKNRARVRAQQSMIYHFSEILENQEYSQEALAILIYQELEAAAANPETRRLLPSDTLSMLAGIRAMLMPSQKPPAKPLEESLPFDFTDENNQY